MTTDSGAHHLVLEILDRHENMVVKELRDHYHSCTFSINNLTYYSYEIHFA